MARSTTAAPSAVLRAAGFFLLSAAPTAMAEEEISTTPVECSISVMLLGSMGFQMLLFYLVNWPDRDIRKYSWRVISQTISIFCAVLLFQGFNGLIEVYVIEGGTPLWEVGVDMMQLVVWLTALQVVLAVTSGAINELIGGGEPDMEKVELRVKSWSVLFAHLAGFSAINAWGSLQQHVFQGSPLVSFSVVPIGFVGLFVMYHGYDTVREHIAHMDDGEKDEFEVLWDEETQEAEEEVAGLSLSFLTAQTVRYHISGVLPNQEGLEDWEFSISHTSKECQYLLGCGAVFFVCSLIPLLLENALHARIHRMSSAKQEWVKRVVETLNNFFTFANAWCFFYGMKWAVSATQFTQENGLLSVVLALLLSAIAFILIFALDKIADNQLLGEDSAMADNATEKLITALGILIGFSWEQSFDTAVGVVAASLKESCNPAVSKLLMSMLLVAIVFPAWRLYILKTERELAEDESEEREMLKEFAHQHRELFLSDIEEHHLDLAHLKLKHHRRQAHGHSVPAAVGPSGEKLKHYRVTAKGVEEVHESEQTPASKKKTGGHRKEITRRLLDHDHHHP